MSFLKHRFWLVMGVAAFAGAFQWVYITWLQPTFGYMGFTYSEPPLGYQVLAWTLSILPAFWMPMWIKRPSQLISWVLLLTVLIPSEFVVAFVQLRDLDDLRWLMLVLFAGFAITTVPQRLPLLRIPRFEVSHTIFWICYWALVSVFVIWVIAVYQGHFHLVAFSEVYDGIRFSAREVGKGTGVGYATMGLSGSLIPFLLSWALVKKRPFEFVFGVLVLVLLYSTAGLKSILTSAVFTPALYVLMRGDRIPFATKLTWVIVAGFVGLNIANLMAPEMGGFQMMLSAVLFARTFGGPGLLTAMYDDFFANNPFTYYSQVNGVNWIIPYPYEHSIGVELGYYFSGRVDLNSNAHLWCADGIASLGLVGVLLVSCFCAMVFWILDSASEGHPPIFTGTAVSFAALNLSNMSLFTTLLSGGLFMSILCLYAMPRELLAEETEVDEELQDEAVGEFDLPPDAELEADVTDLVPLRHSQQTSN